MAELTLKINIRRLVGEKPNNLRHSNQICQWNQAKSQKRLDLVTDLGPLWKCNLVVKSILFLHEWVTFIHRFQSDPWLIIQNYLPPTPQCAEWKTVRGKREGAFHSYANLNISLSSPCQSASGSKHLLDRWRHSHAEAGARVTLNPQCKRDLGCIYVCVCVWVREKVTVSVCVSKPEARLREPWHHTCWIRSWGAEMGECVEWWWEGGISRC